MFWKKEILKELQRLSREVCLMRADIRELKNKADTKPAYRSKYFDKKQ